MVPEDLFAAVEACDIPSVKDAIRAGVDVEARTDGGATPLLLAAQFRDTAMVRALLSGGADVRAVHAKDRSRTTLHYASLRNDVAMIDELFGAGALVDAADARGATPLHDAAAFGLAEAVEALLERGADPSMRDGAERTPLDLARAAASAKGTARAIELLEAAHPSS